MLEAWMLSTVLGALRGRLAGPDAFFNGVSIDSRRIEPGQLFVALSGARFDGHDYLEQVAAKSAAAALVEREQEEVELPQLVVADTRLALGQLGALNRAAFRGRVAAVTGSSGKTTVKEMLASILRADHGGDAAAVLATRGNLNNDLGVPLTLLELAPQHRSAVIELGANHVGEIAYTVGLSRPQVAIITNAGSAHVGEFGGPEKIVEAKGEILEGLDADGVAVLNRDDPAFEVWSRRAAGRQVLSFAMHAAADFSARELARDARGCPAFTLVGPAGEVRIQLNLLGEHNVANALAAAAAAHALGVGGAAIRAGLEALQPVKGRACAQLAPSGMRVIDDSYNANPAAIKAAIDILAGFSGRTVLVLGDMGELGAWAEAGHREVGAYARGKVDALYAVGPLMSHAVAAFGEGARHFASQAELIAVLAAEQSPETTLLIKGSRSAAMENVVAAFCACAGEH
ncbi:UDP-N-acetylmuramoyl-tripeptide:D-alanyl-D-alanine ligase [Pseudomonas sp. OF001]|uniref:UDP-N-acetylmuramoyl-tripeptide--D-alanyl-D- alanine ligase n=1 Tax=Pseudomonas sp. OF001 TaxID=2772300 RepID=UPI00191A6C71|nr:UDP-N-acetylmuramoyl-tripeptide--D-alanyl-D-alanine ligase [Pseudomonas sp. OF001]CAD5375671.1 UDP-N-acetylmuramoyl-tripeptide:D-alanyl-D-alanine ligase [Pseudomonas sp. OF001]